MTITLHRAGRSGLAPRPPRSWPLPVALVLLSLVPVIAGTLRLVQLLGGPAVIHADHRFDSSPARVVARVDRPEPPFTWATAMILVFMS